MTRQDIVEELKKYFSIKELVCNHTYKAFGETAWQFFDRDFLETLLIVRRDIFKKPILVNYKSFTQRGFRCNICQLVRNKTSKGQIYLTSHSNGAAIDFDVEGYTAEQARQFIILYQDLLPYKIRLEANVSWVHLDIYDSINIKEKVHLFSI